MDAKIRLLSSAGAASDEKLDIRIARERVMMHQACLPLKPGFCPSSFRPCRPNLFSSPPSAGAFALTCGLP